MKKRFWLWLLPFLGECKNSVNGVVYPDADRYLCGDQTYEGTVTEIHVDWIAGNVTLVEDETMKGVQVKEANDLPDEDKVHSYFHDGVLDVQYIASGRKSNVSSSDKKLVLTYNPVSLAKLDLDITTGALNASTLHASESIHVDLTTGNFTAGSIATPEFDLDLTTGAVETKFASLSHGIIDVTTGSVALTLPPSGGKVKVEQVTGRVDARRDHVEKDGYYVFGEGSATLDVSIVTGSITID